MAAKKSKSSSETAISSEKLSGLSCLLAFDGSEHAQAAVSFVMDLPKTRRPAASKCSVTLMSVLPTQSIGGHEPMQAELNEAESRLKAAGFEVSSILKAGNPAATINAYAEEHPTDLIVIGAKGRRATLGILLGGVAQQIVEYSTCPVLVVRAPYRGLKRILMVIDGSNSSKHALDYIVPPCPDGSRLRCSWLPSDSSLRLMHVLPLRSLTRPWFEPGRLDPKPSIQPLWSRSIHPLSKPPSSWQVKTCSKIPRRSSAWAESAPRASWCVEMPPPRSSAPSKALKLTWWYAAHAA